MSEYSPASFALPGAARLRVALLVDGDNMAATQAAKLIAQVADEGELIISRVYAGPGGLTNWEKSQGFHLRHAGSGKNAADLLLTVEAMEIMLTGKADVMVIATSDRDFAHLATHLRESGRRVVAISEEKAPEHFRRCCSAHHVLPAEAAPPAVAPPKPKPLTLPDMLAKVITAHAEKGWVPIQRLGTLMATETGKTLSGHGISSWRALIQLHPDRFECEPKGPSARVRLR